MSDSFGLKIGVEGEKEFKKALLDINQQFKVLGSEMKLATSQFGKNENSVEALASKNEVLSKQIDAQKSKIATLRDALKNASVSFGENDRRTQQWAAALNNAEADLNDMEREVKDNEQAIESMGNGMDSASSDARQLGAAIDDSGREAEGASSRFDGLGRVAKATAAAMAAAFAAVAAAAVAAGKALVEMTKAGAEYADGVLTTSTQTGIATDTLQEYMYAAELVDVPVETLTKSMAKQIKSMKSASDGSASFADAYKQLGVSVTNADGSLRNSDDVYWETIDALGGMTNETERDALAMTLLGKSAQELNPLIEAGADRMAELGEQAHTAGYVISDELLAAYGAYDDQCQYLEVGTQAAKNALGTIMFPVLTDLATEGVTLLGDFTNAILDADGDISKIGDVIGEYLPVALDKVMEYLPAVNEVIGSVFGSFGKAILDNLPSIVDSASQIVLSFLTSFLAALPVITDGAVQLVTALVNGLLDNLPDIVDAALEMVVSLAEGIADSLPELVPAAVDAVILVCETLLKNMDKILAAAKSIIEGLAEGLINALPELIEALPEVIRTIISFVTDNLPQIGELGITLIVQLAVGIVQAIPQLVASLPQVIAAIIEGIGKAAISIVNVGKSIVQGLWSGISSMISWLWEKVSGWVSNLVGGIKNALGIHSPSTVFAGIGENMGKGVGIGFTDAMRSVSEDMRKAIPTTFDMDTTLNGVNVIGSAAIEGQAFNVTIPLSINGSALARVLAQIQWTQNAVYVRNLGVS